MACWRHGLHGTKVYRAWRAMLGRCYSKTNASYADYGGRGIYVCDEWRYDVSQFSNDMGAPPSPTHSLGRIDNDGPYTPANCQWQNASQQNSNKRNKGKVLLTHNERTQSMTRWAAETGINVVAICQRLQRGWSVEAALTIPLRPLSKPCIHTQGD